jgi:hypothetical protein
MQINSPATAPDYTAGNLREGTLDSKVLARGREGSLNNYRLSFETAEESWSTPRHRHNFDQIRLPVKGTVEYGKALPTLPIGVVAYFPESVHYGPQVRHDGSQTLTLQLGGASANGFMSPEERKRGFDDLLKKGTFEKGAFNYVDDKGQVHRQDSYEAVWEYIRQRKLVYANPRYTTQVVMDPENFEWLADGRQRGVSRKWLGSFTERQLHISYVRIEPGTTLRLDNYAAPQILFVVKGAVSCQGKAYGLHTAFALESRESAEFAGAEPNELLHIQFPIFAEEESAAAGSHAARARNREDATV